MVDSSFIILAVSHFCFNASGAELTPHMEHNLSLCCCEMIWIYIQVQNANIQHKSPLAVICQYCHSGPAYKQWTAMISISLIPMETAPPICSWVSVYLCTVCSKSNVCAGLESCFQFWRKSVAWYQQLHVDVRCSKLGVRKGNFHRVQTINRSWPCCWTSHFSCRIRKQRGYSSAVKWEHLTREHRDGWS